MIGQPLHDVYAGTVSNVSNVSSVNVNFNVSEAVRIVNSILEETIYNILNVMNVLNNNDIQGNSVSDGSKNSKKSNINKLYKKPNLPEFDIKEKFNLRFYVTNLRGFFSKKETLEKLVDDLSVDLIAISESHTSGEIAPKLNGFSCFYRNRRVRCKGGTALLVRESIAADAVEVFSGEEENEILGVMLGKANPPCIVMTVYGTQANTFGNETVSKHVKEMFGAIDPFIRDGAQCLILGDANLALGRENIENNDMFLSVPGKLFNERINDYNLQVMNNLSQDPTTHTDARSGLKRALDVVVASHPEKVNKFVIDHEWEFTPFSVRCKGGEFYKINSDHKAIIFDYELGESCELMREVKKPKAWQYCEEGDIAYSYLTDCGFDHLRSVAESSEDVESMTKKLDSFITKCKFKSYKMKTYSKNQFDDFAAEEIWKHRIQQIEKMEKDVENESEANKVFKTKVRIEGMNTAESLAALKDADTGQLLTEVDDIFDYIINFNVRNMDKIEGSDEVKMIQEMKAEMVMNALNERDDCPQEIPWEIFMEVTKKVIKQHKAVMRDFVKGGAMFKVAVFMMLNRVYKEEVIPESMFQTTLTKIYKRRGNKGELKSFRFIHGRSWFSKIFEKCLVLIVQKPIDVFTPENQIGGLAGHGCREHLMTVTTMMKINEFLGKSTLLTLIDVSSMFDKVVLSDAMFDAVGCGADKKALFMLQNYNKKSVIKIKGDPDEGRTRVVENTLGQGTNYAPKIISLTMGLGIDNVIPVENMDKAGEVEIPPRSYIDDIGILNASVDAARKNGVLIGRALEVLSLRANPKKSTIVVTGGKKDDAARLRQELKDDPVLIHGSSIGVSEVDPYLGMYIHEKGIKESINHSVKMRVNRAWGRAYSIKNIVNAPAMKAVGWMRSAIVLVQATIPPILAYGSECYLTCPKYVIKNIEAAFKQIVYSVFEITEKTKYSSVLLELGLMRMSHYIAKLQLSYMSQVVHDMVGTMVHAVVMEEFKLKKENSSLAAADDLALSYGLKKISESAVDKKILKKVIRNKHDMEVWHDCFSSPIISVRPYLGLITKAHFNWDKLKSKAMIAVRTGSLKFKNAWRLYNVKRGVGVRCVNRMCDGIDELKHAQVCKFYNTKWDDKFLDSESDMAEYILQLNRERLTRYRLPIL